MHPLKFSILNITVLIDYTSCVDNFDPMSG